MTDEERVLAQFTIKLTVGDDGWIVAECVELPGCISQGKTQLSALANVNDAIRAVLKVRADAAKRITEDQ